MPYTIINDINADKFYENFSSYPLEHYSYFISIGLLDQQKEGVIITEKGKKYFALISDRESMNNESFKSGKLKGRIGGGGF